MYDNSVTARTYIGHIAESAGCFASIGRDGKLYFRNIYQDEVEMSIDLFSEYKWGEEFKISKVSYEDGTRSFKFGNDINNNLWIDQDNVFVVDEEQIQNIYNNVKELTINSFEGSSIIDPAIDIGDKIIIDGKTIVYQGEMILAGKFVAQINSKIQIKQKEETTVKKESQRSINRKVKGEIDQINGEITQLVSKTDGLTEELVEQKLTTEGITNIVSETTKRLNNDYLTAEQVNAGIEGTKEDINILKQKQASTELTIDGFQIQIDTINNEGVNKVKTSMGYTFDDEGMKINKENADTGTIVDEAGFKVVDKTGYKETNLLYAGYVKEEDSNYPNYVGQTIVATSNIVIENYLVVGSNSRFEDYTNPTLGGKGTGVFEI